MPVFLPERFRRALFFLLAVFFLAVFLRAVFFFAFIVFLPFFIDENVLPTGDITRSFDHNSGVLFRLNHPGYTIPERAFYPPRHTKRYDSVKIPGKSYKKHPHEQQNTS
jgi:hypothetical protein